MAKKNELGESFCKYYNKYKKQAKKYLCKMLANTIYRNNFRDAAIELVDEVIKDFNYYSGFKMGMEYKKSGKVVKDILDKELEYYEENFAELK